MIAAQFHALVNVFGRRDAFSQHKKCLIDHGHQNAVDHKAGRIFDGDGGLAQCKGERVHGGMALVVRLKSTDHFHQGHHGHWVEKMHANEALGVLGDRSELCDGDGGGIGGEHGVSAQVRLELLQDLDFEGQILCGRLDHQVTLLKNRIIGAGVNARQRLQLVAGAQFFFGHQALQAIGDGSEPFVQCRLVDVHHMGGDATHSASLRNSRAHGA